MRVAAGCPQARERLLCYCARAPLSLERLQQRDDGTITYQLRHGNKICVMTPMQFMARLAALIPPPRHPLIRFHGVFAPHSQFRKRVVPVSAAAGPEDTLALEQEKADPSMRAAASAPPSKPPNETPAADSASTTSVHEATGSAGEKAPRPSSRIDWATLLRRVYAIDALECPACKGRMRFTDLFEDKATAREELQRRGLPTEPPPLARARSPDAEFG